MTPKSNAPAGLEQYLAQDGPYRFFVQSWERRGDSREHTISVAAEYERLIRGYDKYGNFEEDAAVIRELQDAIDNYDGPADDESWDGIAPNH